MNSLNILLHSFVLDSENDHLNFELARAYKELGHTASAISYYLRCAELTKNSLLQYECLLHAANCFNLQGNRNLTVRILLQHAISIDTTRPEAYWMISKIYEQDTNIKDHLFNAYTYACIGMVCCTDNHKPFKYTIGFPGVFVFKFQRAITAWKIGLTEEAKKLFSELDNDTSIPTEYRQTIKYNVVKSSVLLM